MVQASHSGLHHPSLPLLLVRLADQAAEAAQVHWAMTPVEYGILEDEWPEFRLIPYAQLNEISRGLLERIGVEEMIVKLSARKLAGRMGTRFQQDWNSNWATTRDTDWDFDTEVLGWSSEG